VVRTLGCYWSEVDHVDSVAGITVRVVGEHHRGSGACLMDDPRDLKLTSGFAGAAGCGTVTYWR